MLCSTNSLPYNKSAFFLATRGKENLLWTIKVNYLSLYSKRIKMEILTPIKINYGAERDLITLIIVIIEEV